jgi:TolB-like protein/Flp pilus assembly protein TadD
LDLAFEQLNILIKVPGGRLNYGDLKTYPGWDPLRKDPRFDKLLAELAPHESAEKSIAVLPFESLSDNKSDAYFADGVQDEILNNLAKIAQLKVISRTSVMKYRPSSERDLRQIANALGVSNVLEGTVRRDGNHVRVSTELVDARSDNTIWADSYDRDLTDIFAIQSDVAKTVAGKLAATLSSTEKKRIEAKPTENLEAYDLYLRAREQIPRKSSSLVVAEQATFSKGLAFLEEATRMDPNFALGYCLIATVHDFLYDDQFDHTPERRALGDAAVDKALQLQPDLPEVHLAVAFHLYTCYRDFERARVQLAIAAQSLSNSPDLLELMAIIDRVQGRWEEATTGLEKAVNLDPRNPELLEELASLYGFLRRYRDADRLWDRAIELEPGQQIFQAHKAWNAFLEKGDVKRVRAAYEALPSSMKDDVWITGDRIYFAACDRDFKTAHEIVRKSPNEELYFGAALVPRRCLDIWLEMVQGNHPTMAEFGVTREQLSRKAEADRTNAPLLSALSCVDIGLGRKEEAISEGKRAIEMLPISNDATIGPILVQNLALVYAWADEPDLAFEQLSILMEGSTNALRQYGVYKFEPSWDPLRKDPRFDKLLAELAPRD